MKKLKTNIYSLDTDSRSRVSQERWIGNKKRKKDRIQHFLDWINSELFNSIKKFWLPKMEQWNVTIIKPWVRKLCVWLLNNRMQRRRFPGRNVWTFKWISALGLGLIAWWSVCTDYPVTYDITCLCRIDSASFFTPSKLRCCSTALPDITEMHYQTAHISPSIWHPLT